jgi:hypothetical protein
MPLETGTYISDLVATNPGHTDQVNQGDGHIKLIKGTLQATFPNLNGAVTAAPADLNKVTGGNYTGGIHAPDGTGGAPSITFGSDTTAGFRKGARTGQTLVEGVLRGPGALPVGMLADFPSEPPRFSKGGTAAGGEAAIDWLELDGSTYNVSDYPDLAAFFGASGSTFSVPNTKDVGRFRRSRTATLTAGTYQAHAIRNHAHTGTTDLGGSHTHTATDAGHTHPTWGPSGYYQSGSTVGGPGNIEASITHVTNTGYASISVSTDPGHTHTFTTGTTGDDIETRPVSYVVVSCIKT